MELTEIVWLVLTAVFLITEAVCAIHLVSIWFAAGALCALVSSLLGAQLWLQILLFLVVSGGLLAALWPITKKFLNRHHTPTNLDAIIGSQGLVTAPIDNTAATGQVKLGAMEWTARSTDGAPLPVGTRIRVDRIEGVKVFVSLVKKTVKTN